LDGCGGWRFAQSSSTNNDKGKEINMKILLAVLIMLAFMTLGVIPLIIIAFHVGMYSYTVAVYNGVVFLFIVSIVILVLVVLDWSGKILSGD